MRTWLVMAIAVFGLAACTPQVQKRDPENPYVRGTARVVSVDQTLGRVVLDYQHQQVEAYWQTEQGFAQGGALGTPDTPLKPPVGLYRQPNVQVQELEAQPGDTIEFVGMWTGRSIYLRGVAVVSH